MYVCLCVCNFVWLWRMLSTKANSKLHADCIAHVDDEAYDDDDDTLGRQTRATPVQAVSCIHCMHKANGNVP